MVKICRKEIKDCYDFAFKAWEQKSQSDRNFGTDPRNQAQFIADQVTGKISELVFKKHMEELCDDIVIEVNFEHYLDPLTTDNGDVRIFKDDTEIQLRIDVKGSSNRAQWMVIEQYKYRHLQTGEKVSDKYVMVRLGEDMPTNPELRENPKQILDKESVSGEVVGWIRHEDLDCPNDGQPWFVYTRGDRLLNTWLLPREQQKIQDRQHLTNYINKVERDNPDYYRYIGPELQAQVNIGFPIKWMSSKISESINE